MISVKKSRLVPHTCEQMFNLVNEVEHYPEFLPYCTGSQVHHRDQDEVQATLTIAAAGMHKSFTTRNHLQQNKMIEIRLIEGPFSQLEGFWRFDAEKNDACHISFDLEFEFSGALFAKLMGPLFEQVADKMVDSFCLRAGSLYGSR